MGKVKFGYTLPLLCVVGDAAKWVSVEIDPLGAKTVRLTARRARDLSALPVPAVQMPTRDFPVLFGKELARWAVGRLGLVEWPTS